jgi:hypothetical protein
MGTYKNSRIPVWHKALKVFFWGEIPQSNREIKKIVISIFYTGELGMFWMVSPNFGTYFTYGR